MIHDEHEAHPDDLADVQRRSRQHKRWFHRNQPKPVAQVLADVVQRRGYAQLRTAKAWEQAWRDAVGERFAAHTSLGDVKRGVLEVVVANSLLVQELGFEKHRILTELQRALPDVAVKQLRFRVGKVP